MPELPEVETVRQILRSEVIGKTIQEIEIYKLEDETKKRASLVKEISEAEFINTLVGKVIYKIDRKEKAHMEWKMRNRNAMVAHIKS